MKVLIEQDSQPTGNIIYLKSIVDGDGNSVKIYLHNDNLVLHHGPSGITLQFSPAECLTFAGILMSHAHRIMLDLTEQDLPDKSPIGQYDMVLVRGGTFSMGDQFGEGYGDETPVHSVTLSDYYMGKYPVTFDEYDEFCAATGREKPDDNDWGSGRRPVINVDWYDAVEYCNWRSQKENLGAVYSIDKSRKDPNNQHSKDTKKWTVVANYDAKGYRLPTEAEWEYAAREGGKKVRFGNGKDIADPKEINFYEDVPPPYSIKGLDHSKTVEVGSLNSPNALGLYDMSGNVCEWCGDWYGEQYYADSAGARNPFGPDSGKFRVLRGGSWYYLPETCRVTSRHWFGPGFQFFAFGFRVARGC